MSSRYYTKRIPMRNPERRPRKRPKSFKTKEAAIAHAEKLGLKGAKIKQLGKKKFCIVTE